MIFALQLEYLLWSDVKKAIELALKALKKYPTEEYLYYCLAQDKYAIKAKKWATKVRSPAGPPVSTSAPDY